MKYRGMLLLLAVLPATAHAENWRTVIESEEFPAFITYVDTDSISRTGDNIEYALWEFQEGDDGYVGDNFVQKRSVNCSAGTFVIFSDQSYTGTTPKGAPTQLTKTTVAQPGGADRRSLDAVCGTGKYLSDKISDPAYDADDYFFYLDGW